MKWLIQKFAVEIIAAVELFGGGTSYSTFVSWHGFVDTVLSSLICLKRGKYF